METQVIQRFFIVTNGRISSSDATLNGAVLDNFGNVRFTGPCWLGPAVATWTGVLNAGAGPKFGQGNYTCTLQVVGGTWRVYNGR